MTKAGYSRKRGAIPRRAPGDFGILHDLVRTAPHGERADRLAQPADLARWLIAHELLPAEAEVTTSEHRRGVALRDALTALVRQEPGASSRIEEVSRSARFQLDFDDRGTPRYEPVSRGFDRAFATVLAMYVEARRQGDWRRLKPCQRCGAIFYDSSHNQVAKWCTDRCGERVRGAAARRRQRYSG